MSLPDYENRRRLVRDRPLSKRQQQIRDAAHRLRQDSPLPPALSAIAREAGIKSHSYVGRVVEKLKHRKEWV